MMTHKVRLGLICVFAFATEVARSLPHHRIRGVNLGGWLVLERWIKPSLFRDGWENDGWVFSEYNPKTINADEWSFCELLGKEECSQRLMKHWDTWVTFEDMQKLASAGINHLRVPVGYWIMGGQDGEPYVTGKEPGTPGSSLYYLTRVCDWARENGQQVWIDLHGAPGSQNGFDNSGHFGNVTWNKSRSNVERSVKVLENLAKHFATHGYEDVMTGIGLLNEPAPKVDSFTLTEFYAEAFRATRTHLPDVNIFLGDRFMPSDWNQLWATGGPDGFQDWTKPTQVYQQPLDRKLASSASPNLVNANGVDSMSLEALQHLPLQSDIPVLRKSMSQLRGGGRQSQGIGIDEYELERKLMKIDLGRNKKRGSFANSKGQVLLDTHIYHMFTDNLRLLPAVRHIGRICLHDFSWINHCCWAHDKPTKLKRMIGEWTAAFDQLPSWGLEDREATIEPSSEERVMFLKHFVYAQMVTYELEEDLKPPHRTQAIQGWFFWNFKMELEVYREWDYLKGLERGWIPHLPTNINDTRIASELFGSCEEQRQVILEEGDAMAHVVDAFPDKKYFPQYPDPATAPTDDDWRDDWDTEESANNGAVVCITAFVVGAIAVITSVAVRWIRKESKGYSPVPSAADPRLRGEISISDFARS